MTYLLHIAIIRMCPPDTYSDGNITTRPHKYYRYPSYYTKRGALLQGRNGFAASMSLFFQDICAGNVAILQFYSGPMIT